MNESTLSREGTQRIEPTHRPLIARAVELGAVRGRKV